MELKICFQSSPNIALIKYWGKYNEKYILPINDSIGLTLSPKDFHTKTTVIFSKNYDQDKLILNGKEHPRSQRLQTVFRIIREKAYPKYQNITQQQWKKYHFYVESVNSFPTASGMASSASGLACLASALNGLFGNILNEIELSQLARFGSGSASRSVFGGLVRWKGVQKNLVLQKKISTQQELQKLSKQCISFSIRSSQRLSYIKIICFLATNKEKQISSTKGMKNSVETSQLIKYRNQIALNRISKIQACLDEIQAARSLGQNKEVEYKKFNEFCQTVIQDSNQFHAICLDTYPPIFYLNEFSKQVIEVTDQYINKKSNLKMAYTFDAGPHAFLFIHEDNIHEIFTYLENTFKISQNQLNNYGKRVKKEAEDKKIEIKIPKYEKQTQKPYAMWLTEVGPESKPYELQ